MRRCESCGKKVFDDKLSFCPKCGAEFGVADVSNGTMQGGFDAISNGRFKDAVERWTGFIAMDPAVSDEDYSSMVKAMCDCIVLHIADREYLGCQEVTDLARGLIPGRHLMKDLMAGLKACAPEMKGKKQLVKLAGEYMFIAMASYGVYPNIRDMAVLMKGANRDMQEFKSLNDSMDESDLRADLQYNFYVNYTSEIAEKISTRVVREGPESMGRIVKYWSTQSKLVYADNAIMAAKAYSDYAVSMKESPRKEKAKNNAINDFMFAYFEGPYNTKKKKTGLWK